ncbi:MAG: 3-oxoacyl-ACP reductase family protein [Candidatus Altiarchaeota archaeon]
MLRGKVALVTGATRGIGKATAVTLAREGSNVVVNYIRGAKVEGGEVVKQIRDFGGDALLLKADVSKYKQVGDMVENALNHYGRIDILVNNAGIVKNKMIWNLTPEMWDDVVNVNLTGTFNCCKHVVPQMIERKTGRITNIAATSAQFGNIGQANYIAAKAGIIGLTKALARELAPKGINVNAVSPGYIDTDIHEGVPRKALEDLVDYMIPLNRPGTPQEVANTVLFLASDMSKYITGQVINVNGGLYM